MVLVCAGELQRATEGGNDLCDTSRQHAAELAGLNPRLASRSTARRDTATLGQRRAEAAVGEGKGVAAIAAGAGQAAPCHRRSQIVAAALQRLQAELGCGVHLAVLSDQHLADAVPEHLSRCQAGADRADSRPCQTCRRAAAVRVEQTGSLRSSLSCETAGWRIPPSSLCF